MSIQKSDLVLELGSGDNPNPRSMVLVDKFFEPTPHRKNTPMKLDGRPIIIADAEQLPFRDKSFDYVICAHIIEHIPNVEIALKEIMRVAKAGYIETPSVFAEHIVGKHEIHLWNLLTDGETLFLNRKTESNRNNLNTEEIFDNLFSDLFWEYSDVFFVKFEWKDSIRYSIIGDEEVSLLCSSLVKKWKNVMHHPTEFDSKRLKWHYNLLKREIKNRFKQKLPSPLREWLVNFENNKTQLSRRSQAGLVNREQLNSMLCCPRCHGTMTLNNLRFTCQSCNQVYEERFGAMDFLVK
jgi:SAM-dependent methyltransferase